MLPDMKKKLKKWLHRLLCLAIVSMVVWLNINRFNHNIYANYEKAVDYGRVREVKEVINPVIAAVFYAGKEDQKTTVSSYLNHLDNYNMQNVKMAIVPEKITPESQGVLEKLYREIHRHNPINYIVLVHRQNEDIVAHERLLNQIFQTKEIELADMSDNVAQIEESINSFLKEADAFVVFTADLKHDNDVFAQNLLINEAIYFAQNNFYKIHIFDEIDTQLAKAWEDEYAELFEVEEKEESRLVQQKSNLEAYINHYGADILKYFIANLRAENGEKVVWPQKNNENYRLFDRGYIYVRFFTDNHQEIFSRAKIGKNKGIVVGVIEVAHKAVNKIFQPIKSAKIYLLTDLERIIKDEKTPLINYLERDDGIYIQYHKKIALFAADERPNNEEELRQKLWQRAQISENVADKDIEFYKFKTVEIDYEN